MDVDDTSSSHAALIFNLNPMQRLSVLPGVFVASLIVVLAKPGAAQPDSTRSNRDSVTLDSVFRAHRYPVTLHNGRLSGPGAAFLAKATRRAQFVMMAESHYVGEIPQFTAAWFDELKRTRGFDYYAIEYGPTVGRLLSVRPVRGDTAATIALGARYPHAFQFLNDEELEAMASIARRSTAASPIWGLDNEWGALHLLDRLIAIAPNASARRAATRLADSARQIEKDRGISGEQARFISDVDTLLLRPLRVAFNPRAGTEADRLLEALEISHCLYTFNDAAGKGHLTGYRANLEREQYQKRLFMENYRAAQRAGDTLPHVLLKFGSLHGAKGLSRTNVYTFGNFIHEFAAANSAESFHLVAWLVNEPGKYWSITEEKGYGPLGRAGSTGEWVVVDLRPMRPLVHAGRLRGLSQELRSAIFGYDAVLLIGNGTRGTYDALLKARGSAQTRP